MTNQSYKGASALKMHIGRSASGVMYGHVASCLNGCAFTAWYSTIRRRSLGLYLGEQDVKGG
jgi:hypothetical protein